MRLLGEVISPPFLIISNFFHHKSSPFRKGAAFVVVSSLGQGDFFSFQISGLCISFPVFHNPHTDLPSRESGLYYNMVITIWIYSNLT
jgi:hypothetical protein